MEFHAGLYTALVNLRSDAEVSFDGAGSSDRVDDAIGNDWEENEDKVNRSCSIVPFHICKGLNW